MEVQGTGEHGTFDRAELDRLLDLATQGLAELDARQRARAGTLSSGTAVAAGHSKRRQASRASPHLRRCRRRRDRPATKRDSRSRTPRRRIEAYETFEENALAKARYFFERCRGRRRRRRRLGSRGGRPRRRAGRAQQAVERARRSAPVERSSAANNAAAARAAARRRGSPRALRVCGGVVRCEARSLVLGARCAGVIVERAARSARLRLRSAFLRRRARHDLRRGDDRREAAVSHRAARSPR